MKNSIGVRCCPNRTTLWFHLEGVLRFADPTCHIGIGSKDIESLEQGSHGKLARVEAWAALTPEGKQITKRILSLPCMPQPAEILGRDDYFDLTLPYNTPVEAWDEVLPAVVGVICEVRGKQLQLRREPPNANTFEEWHLPLLRRHGARV